jgi:ATP-dependent RNA helicase RhlE
LKTFKELGLIEPLQQALDEVDYEIPTPIQARAIPAALGGSDVLGCAQTGTGKTGAFALPILNRLGQKNRKAIANRVFALVLAPTRELAIQIEQSFAKYGQHLRLRRALVYGGVNQNRQVRMLNRGAHVLVATPGRLLDLMDQGYLELDRLEVFVLDEADRMLDMGFLPDLKRIINQLPDRRQSLFFSATLPPPITKLAQTLLRKPLSVNVTPKKTSVKKIDQRVIFVERKGKQELLKNRLQIDGVERVLVFTKTKRTANTVAEKLSRTGIKAAAFHGNKSQNSRQRTLEAFRQSQVKVLVATDVAARGIDIDGITHVINFDLPVDPENYVHRIGRTGRAGAAGIALSFCSPKEQSELCEIEKFIGQEVPLDPDQPRSVPRGGTQSNTEDFPAKRPSRRGGANNPASPKSKRARRSSGASTGAGSGKKPQPKQDRRRRKQVRAKQSGGSGAKKR